MFTGLLEICPDADSLATVLGHEMAHTIARHSSEKLSYAQLFTWSLLAAHYALGIDLTWVQGLIYNFVVNLPRSRMVESEADYIGWVARPKHGLVVEIERASNVFGSD